MPTYLRSSGWLIDAGRDGKGPRTPWLTINNVLGLLRACQRGLGVAMLPDYLVEENGGLVQLFGDIDDFTLRRVLRLSGRAEIRRAHPGVPRLPGREGAAVEFLNAQHLS